MITYTEEIEVQLQLIDNVVMEYQLNKLRNQCICEIKKVYVLQKLEDIIVKSKLHNQEFNEIIQNLQIHIQIFQRSKSRISKI